MYIHSSAIEDVLSAAEKLCSGQNDVITVFFADKDVPDINEFRREFTNAGIRVMGGIAPGLIVGTTRRDSGALIRRFTCVSGPFVVSDPVNEGISQDILQRLRTSPGAAGSTVMLYLPGHSSASHLLRQVYGMFGNGVTYLGSGMGYEDEICRPCVFSNDVFSDCAAVFAVLSEECTVNARHGFIPISEFMVSTRTDHNLVKEINWRNPWNEYLAAIGDDCSTKYPRIKPEECIMKYPLVLQTEFPESICRGVLQKTPEGFLVCAGDVPENAIFRVAAYSYESMIEAAASSVRTVTRGMADIPAVIFLIDCVSRTWNAGERYTCELEAVEQVLSDKPVQCDVEGILSFGEISSMGTGMIEYLNYTCVAGRFYEE